MNNQHNPYMLADDMVGHIRQIRFTEGRHLLGKAKAPRIKPADPRTKRQLAKTK